MKHDRQTFRKLVLQRLRHDRQGQDLVEYALAAGLIAVAAVGAMPVLTTTISHVFSRIAIVIQSAVG